MPVTSVVGLQWGDEAKGKLVDLLTSRFDVVVRHQGGANAGHTVVVGKETYKLHQVPSGILTPRVTNVVAPGVVLNPQIVLGEIESLRTRGVTVEKNLMFSDRAHVVFPWHVEEDRLLNRNSVEGENIGTTLRGIGPCYQDKVGRTHAIRIGDMYWDDFRQRIERIVQAKNRLLASLDGDAVLDADAIYKQYAEYAEKLQPLVGDTTAYLLESVEQGKQVLAEGAQGALLDVDHGTFPFVTSSNSSGVGVSAGSGIPARWIEKVYGVIKTYTTRVGGGPFPTELDDDTGQHIRDRGQEYGTTTGRPRRCGWFDAVAVRYAARLSGVHTLSAMMLDVLSELDELKVCVAYEIDGRRVEQFPSHVNALRRAVPIYETLPGWGQEITNVRQFEDLPLQAHRYVDRISQLVGFPIEIVSVGPGREQTIIVQKETPVG